jgi:hypothetical protein
MIEPRLPFSAMDSKGRSRTFRPPFNSGDEIEEVTTKVWDELTFDEVQSVFYNWMSRLAWLIKNGREHIIE